MPERSFRLPFDAVGLPTDVTHIEHLVFIEESLSPRDKQQMNSAAEELLLALQSPSGEILTASPPPEGGLPTADTPPLPEMLGYV
jgi:hypothetical protein